MSNTSSGKVAHPVSKSQTPIFNLYVAQWESGSPARNWELEVPEGRNSPNHTYTQYPHLDSVTPHVTQAHSESHTQSLRVPHWDLAGRGGLREAVT